MDLTSFFKVEKKSIVFYATFSFIHSFLFGHLGWFHNLAFVNSAAVNIDVKMSLWYVDFRVLWVNTWKGHNWILSWSVFIFLKSLLISIVARLLYTTPGTTLRVPYTHPPPTFIVDLFLFLCFLLFCLCLFRQLPAV